MAKMTKRDALVYFKESILPEVDKAYPKDDRGRPDLPARQQAWNNYTDGLRKGRQITQRQYDTWSNPF